MDREKVNVYVLFFNSVSRDTGYQVVLCIMKNFSTLPLSSTCLTPPTFVGYLCNTIVLSLNKIETSYFINLI